MGMSTEANLKLLSIGLGGNLPGLKPKCWVRRNMDSSEERRIIKEFVSEIQLLSKLKYDIMPKWIHDGLDKIEDEIFELTRKKVKIWKLNKLRNFKRILENFLKLDVFGYNSRFKLIYKTIFKYYLVNSIYPV